MATLEGADERSLMAAEYVLGTLDASARKQAELLLSNSAPFRREVWFWEWRLALIGLRLRPVEPRPMVWLRIRRQIGRPGRVPPLHRRRHRLLRAWAALATAATVALAVVVVKDALEPAPTTVVRQRVEVPVAQPAYVAVLKMNDADLHWAVTVMAGARDVKVRAQGQAPAPLLGRDAELWLIADSGPISLGVIPQQGEGKGTLPAGATLAAGTVLAVSIEPAGGSPTGAPTGPVVSTAALVTL